MIEERFGRSMVGIRAVLPVPRSLSTRAPRMRSDSVRPSASARAVRAVLRSSGSVRTMRPPHAVHVWHASLRVVAAHLGVVLHPTGLFCTRPVPEGSLWRERRTAPPKKRRSHRAFRGAPEKIRTPDLLIRSQTLYPTELRARACEPRRPGHERISRGSAFGARGKVSGAHLITYLRGLTDRCEAAETRSSGRDHRQALSTRRIGEAVVVRDDTGKLVAELERRGHVKRVERSQLRRFQPSGRLERRRTHGHDGYRIQYRAGLHQPVEGRSPHCS